MSETGKAVLLSHSSVHYSAGLFRQTTVKSAITCCFTLATEAGTGKSAVLRSKMLEAVVSTVAARIGGKFQGFKAALKIFSATESRRPVRWTVGADGPLRLALAEL